MDPQQPSIIQALKNFLGDRQDPNFGRVVKAFLNSSDEERLRGFLLALTSAKTLANIILDGGEVTLSNVVLMRTLETQMTALSSDLKRETGMVMGES